MLILVLKGGEQSLQDSGSDRGAAPPLGGGPASLHDAYTLARQTWPSIHLSYEQFESHASGLGYDPGVAPAYALDVYLCAACSLRQPVAYLALEVAHFPALRAAIQKLVRTMPEVDDVLQEVRARLFLGSSPKIASYRGSGALAAWLRRVALNAAQDQLRLLRAERARKNQLADAEEAVAASMAADELPFRWQRARLCEQAFSAAVHSLGSAERRLLYHYLVSGLSIDVLGPLYSVHRATVARRIRRALEQLRQRSYSALAVHLPKLSRQDVELMFLEMARDLDLDGAIEREVPGPD